jgi:phosphatidylserine/phosphatidylglycerophosphate/cardiolipin synthase-like enzyme
MTLAAVSTADLRNLRDLAAAKALSCPLTEPSLRAHGFGPVCEALLGALPFEERGALVTALELVIDERVRADRPPIELVWSGPDSVTPQTCDTSIVLADLFERVRASVLVAGYWFSQAEMLRPLYDAMCRGVQARVFLHLKAGVGSRSEVPAYAADCVRAFVGDRWPFGAPYPELFYYPETCLRSSHETYLHAKCAVADGRLALVTSANFTTAAHERHIEVGALIDDLLYARRLEGQFNALVAQGTLARADWRPAA